MPTRNQKKAQRRRAVQHKKQTQRVAPVVPEGFLDDQQWLAWAWDRGLDLRDRDQLLDAAAVGLSVLCWRNTVLEDVHAGVERSDRLEKSGHDLEDPDTAAREKQIRREFYERLDVNWDTLARTDPKETARVAVLLEGREQGFGIPDDIMMRLNISTAVDVRDILDDMLPDSASDPGAELYYPRKHVPGHVLEVIQLLEDPDRELAIGGTMVTAEAVLGDSWDQYNEDLYAKVGMHIHFCDLIGARRALWYSAISGVVYAKCWYPNPWWARSVDELQRAFSSGRADEIFYLPEHAKDLPEPAETFWTTLRDYPALLTGPQCSWVQRTRLRKIINEQSELDRQRLGPLEQNRFFAFAALH